MSQLIIICFISPSNIMNYAIIGYYNGMVLYVSSLSGRSGRNVLAASLIASLSFQSDSLVIEIQDKMGYFRVD
jgi:hypothetical protein